MMGQFAGYHGYGYGHMLGGDLFAPLAMHLFGMLVIVGIVLLVMRAVRAPGHGDPVATTGPAPAAVHDEAVSIAKRRYASGEITKDQFDELKRTLLG